MIHPPNPTKRGGELPAAALALVLLALVLLGAMPGDRLGAVSGEVELGRGEPPVFGPAREGDPIDPGDVVRTGSDGRAELLLGRATLRLYPNSLLRVPADAAAGVELERGGSLFDVLRRGGSFEVRTPEVVVSVKGTRFSVSLAETGAAVAVFRGLVGVRGLATDVVFETLVREGFVAAGRDDFELSLHESGDPWDAWSGEPLPALPEPARLRGATQERELLDARSKALAEARSGALEHAARRHPEVAERLADLRERARKRSVDGADAYPAELALDPIADKRSEELRVALEEEFVERYLNGNDAGGPGGTSSLEVSFIDGSGVSGGDRVRVEADPSNFWEFDKNFLVDVLNGDTNLPATLSALLGANGVSEYDFANGALLLFE